MAKTYDGQAEIDTIRKALTDLEFALMPDDQNHKVDKAKAHTHLDTINFSIGALYTAVDNAS